MKKITIQKTHALLENLAEYVMTEVAKKSEVYELRTDFNGLRTEVNGLRTEVNEVKTNVNNIQQKVNIIIDGQDKIVKELGDIRTEQIATNSALLRHEKRITALEENK